MDPVSIDEVESWVGPASVKRPLSRALDATELACNYYELAPGESFAFGYHRHGDQEEVFVILEGTATFETEEGETVVEAGEAVRVAPGEWQRGTNEGDERVVALALGAPADAGDTDLRRHCPECGERRPTEIERAPDDVDATLVTVCQDCGGTTGQFD